MICQNANKNTRIVLFVCTGNTCRSPMAEFYFNSEFGIRNSELFVARSCGLCAESGSYMSAYAKKVLETNNINVGRDDPDAPQKRINEHKSRQISEDIVKEADVIYGITIHHTNRLKEDFPEFTDKIFNMPEEINDPYGGSLEVYEECFKKIKKSVDIIIKSVTEGD